MSKPNTDAIFALGDLRRKLVSEQHDQEFRIAQHLREYRPDFDAKSNKVWAVQDARLCERKARTMEIINMIDKEIRRHE